ncbi:DUF6503 family protein [Psychroserpens sp. SPM9]|uniref:DUF6503 family protein n=1 Tax=Psychroserpens sp. SPM9 TaxID=2975598 RepID=UPI0021A903B2|nr:DUF6503 family protein [Psychroserpens sp. SPM9]MDG5491490.1 DUF6503 family protein [Psychroserpens sp. SPM9]
MKTKILTLLTLIILSSCKDEKTTQTVDSIDYSVEDLDVTTSLYPDHISNVFEAHGGLDAWQKMKTLKFTMTKESGKEITTTDLHNRYSVIEMPKHTLGFDGENVWLRSDAGETYEGKPRFYYNLMFYFYAMPFVLADDGIIYEDIEPLVFEGKSYPGIKISYESGVGESPDDEYLLYYDSDKNQMAWLGYTVTYFSKEKSKTYSFINYSNWQNVNGLILPRQLTWYHTKNNKPTTIRNEVEFTDIVLTESRKEASAYAKPENAEYIK